MRRPFVRCCTAILAVLTIAGCDRSAPARVDSAATPPVAAKPEAVPDTSGVWVARPEGVGPLRVGMTLTELERTLGGPSRVERLEPGAACGFARIDNAPPGVSFMLSHDTLVRIDLVDAGILTAEGAGVGTPESDVLRAYGPRMRVDPHKYTGPEGHYLVTPATGDTTLRVLFETDGARVTRYRVGFADYVALVEGCA